MQLAQGALQRESTPVDGDRKRIAADHLKTLIDTYKHHFDLFVKGWFLYFAVVGAVAGYLGKSDVSGDVRGWAALLIALLSLLGIERCQPLWHWVRGIEESIQQLSNELDVPALSLSGAKAVIRTVQLGCIVVTAVAFALLASRIGPLATR